MTLPISVAGAVLPCLSRLTAALMGIDERIDSPGARLDLICQELNAGAPASVLLYGAGKHTARLLSERHRWERHGHRVVGLIDDHPRFRQMPTHLGLPVRCMVDLRTDAAERNCPPVVLSTDTYQEQFWEKTQDLRDRGVRVFKLYG